MGERDPRIPILVASGHHLLLDAVAILLEREPDLRVVGKADTLEATIEQAERRRPSVVVIGKDLQCQDCLVLIRRLKRLTPRVAVVVISQSREYDMVRAVMCNGASAYVSWGVPSARLLAAIRIAHAGERYLCPHAVDAVVRCWQDERPMRASDGVIQVLSRREKEVACLLARGRTVKEIAGILSISPKTVETHRKNVMDKLGLESVAELVHFAIRHGMISLEIGSQD